MINFSIDKLKDNNIKKGDRVIYKGDNSIMEAEWNLATKFIILMVLLIIIKMINNNSIISDCDAKLIISEN